MAGRYSKNSNGYSDALEGAGGAIDFGGGDRNGRDSGSRGGSYNQDSQEQAARSAVMTKQAADEGLVRTKDLAGFAEGVADRATKRDFSNAVTAKAEDRDFAVTSMNAKASEAAKDRASTSFDKSSANASNLAGIVSTVEGQRDAAKIQGRTAQSGQQAATEQARVAAQAQVSSALLGGRANYGGYW